MLTFGYVGSLHMKTFGNADSDSSNLFPHIYIYFFSSFKVGDGSLELSCTKHIRSPLPLTLYGRSAYFKVLVSWILSLKIVWLPCKPFSSAHFYFLSLRLPIQSVYANGKFDDQTTS